MEIPAFLRNDSFRNTARGIVRVLIEAMGKQAQTPEGVRVVIAFARVVTAMKALMGANINPSPEEVADAVERHRTVEARALPHSVGASRWELRQLVAAEPTLLFALISDDFQFVLRENPAAALEMKRISARRKFDSDHSS